MFGNTLFVTSSGDGMVGKYDAKTGAAISVRFITGLNHPEDLAVLGKALFVANFTSNTVGKYDTQTGAAINTNFIMGLKFPFGMAVKSAK